VDEAEQGHGKLKGEPVVFKRVHEWAKTCREDNTATPEEKEAALQELARRNKNINGTNYDRVFGLIEVTEADLVKHAEELEKAQDRLRESAELYGMAEKVMAGTWVQGLVTAENERRRYEIMPNGLKTVR
jgi:succinate dehydrogenase/fumarate reductase flavoprotein subunit